jgi:hypothetical protein
MFQDDSFALEGQELTQVIVSDTQMDVRRGPMPSNFLDDGKHRHGPPIISYFSIFMQEKSLHFLSVVGIYKVEHIRKLTSQ